MPNVTEAKWYGKVCCIAGSTLAVSIWAWKAVLYIARRFLSSVTYGKAGSAAGREAFAIWPQGTIPWLWCGCLQNCSSRDLAQQRRMPGHFHGRAWRTAGFMNRIGRSASQRCSAVSVLGFSPRPGCSICMTAAHAGKLSKFQWVDQCSFGAPIAKCHSSNCCFFRFQWYTCFVPYFLNHKYMYSLRSHKFVVLTKIWLNLSQSF